MGHPHLLWATCPSASSPSQQRISSTLNLPSSLKPSPLVLSLHSPVNNPSSSFFTYSKAVNNVFQSLPFPRLNNLSHLSLVLMRKILQPFDHLHSLLWTCSNSPTWLLCWGLRAGSSTPGGVLPEQRERITCSVPQPLLSLMCVLARSVLHSSSQQKR